MKPIAFNWQNGGGYGNANEGLAVSEDHTGPCSRSQVMAVAFSSKDHGADATEDLSPTLRAMPHDGSHANGGGQMAVAFTAKDWCQDVGEEVAPTLRSMKDSFDGQRVAVAFQPRIGRNGRGYEEELVPALNGADAGATSDMRPCVVAPSLTASNDPSRSPQSSEITQQVAAVQRASMQVRRLTPVECERLQGFPDGYTAIPWRGKPADQCPDGPRYKALGNSMAVPVMRWIGRRMQMVDECPTGVPTARKAAPVLASDSRRGDDS